MSIQLKLLLGVILIAIITAVGFDLKNAHEKIGTLESTVKTQKDTIAAMTADKVKQELSASIDSDTQIKIDKDDKKIDTAHTALNNKIEAQIDAIHQKYKNNAQTNSVGPITVGDTATIDQNCIGEAHSMEAAEVSAVLINGVWEAYCQAQPGEASCQSPPTPAVAETDVRNTLF